MGERATGKSTSELLMRVLQVESPQLFNDTDFTPQEVTRCYCRESCPLTIWYVMRNGWEWNETYDYFGLGEALEALVKWDKQHGKAVENLG